MHDSTPEYYAALELHLRGLLDVLAFQLKGDDVLDVREFLDVGEYGLALDTLQEAWKEAKGA